jgi:predicted DNA-binding transcriptional regulator AlpA
MAVVKAPSRASVRLSEPVFRDTSPQRLLSVAQTASHIGMSQSWLRKSRVYGTGPRATVLGRRVLYDLRDVDAWLSTRKQASTSAEIGVDA